VHLQSIRPSFHESVQNPPARVSHLFPELRLLAAFKQELLNSFTKLQQLAKIGQLDSKIKRAKRPSLT